MVVGLIVAGEKFKILIPSVFVLHKLTQETPNTLCNMTVLTDS